ncbi:hypothetical protein ACE6H2_018925 [Prunus campanulata]
MFPTPSRRRLLPTLSPSTSSPSLKPSATPFRYPKNAKPPISLSASSAPKATSIQSLLASTATSLGF